MENKAYSKLKASRVLADMANSLLSDGYIMQVKYEGNSFVFYKLKHTRNGSVIEISGLTLKNTFKLVKDGITKKQGTICKQE